MSGVSRMVSRCTRMGQVFDKHEALLASLFEQETGAVLSAAPWLRSRSRFEAFLRTYQDKIRRKARLCRDVEARRDLLAELAVAWLLLQERHLVVEYEKPQANRKGGPDFTATWKTHTMFNVEVKRLRTSEIAREEGPSNPHKWGYAVCDKIKQLPATDFNIVALIVENGRSADDLVPAMKQLKLHAEQKDEPYFHQRGLSVADFFTYYRRLHVIMVCEYNPALPHVHILWINKEARRTLPADLLHTLQFALGEG